MAETIEWVREHDGSYEIQPVVELEEGQAVHIGYEVHLHAELTVGEKVTPELARTADGIRDKLGQILESLIPKDTRARIERVPSRRAVRFLRGVGQKPVITRSVRVFHPDYSAVQPGDRETFHPTERRLEEMGFRRA